VVRRGQLLIALDSEEAKAEVDQARAAVAQAQARLRQLDQLSLPLARQALTQAEVNLRNLQRQHARNVELRDKGFHRPVPAGRLAAQLDVGISQLQSARLQVASDSPGGSDSVLAQTALAQAQANLRIALARLDYTTVEAPLAGTLISRSVERGDVVQPARC